MDRLSMEEIIADEDMEEMITDNVAESSTKIELGSTSGSTKHNDNEGSSCSKGSSQKQPSNILKEMNEKFDGAFVVLKCKNNEEVSVPVPLAVQSGMIEHALDVGMANPSIPLPNVSVSELEMMIEYWKMHVGEAGFDDERRKDVSRWDNEFFTRIGTDALFDLFMAANYLEATGFLDAGAVHVAELVKIMSVDEIRAHFNLTNDFTPEEKQELNEFYPWTDDDM